MPYVRLTAIFVLAAAWSLCGADLRLGIIGTDTSHVPAFTQMLNDDPAAADHIPGGARGGRLQGRQPGHSEQRESRGGIRRRRCSTKWGVEIVPDIPSLLSKVDAVLLESVDGRMHLEQARQVIAAHKPLFIDKPLAATLEDALRDRAPGQGSGSPVVQFLEPALRRDRDGRKFADTTGVIRVRSRRRWSRITSSTFPGTPSIRSRFSTR